MHISQTVKLLNEENSGKFLTAEAFSLTTKYFNQKVNRSKLNHHCNDNHSLDILILLVDF